MAGGGRRTVGRPRGFDADEALERAMVLFWEQGYEGASLAKLTEVMGISTTSMYAAFGNKEELFAKALARYLDGPGGYTARALEEPTAREVAEAVLAGAVRTTTQDARPHGCLAVQGALATGDAGRGPRDLLVAQRDRGRADLARRFRRALEEGDLPPGADPDLLAAYVMTLAAGLAVQAASGVDPEVLGRVAHAGLADWPRCAAAPA